MAKQCLDRRGKRLYRSKGLNRYVSEASLWWCTKEYLEAHYEPVYIKRTGLLGFVDRALGYYD